MIKFLGYHRKVRCQQPCAAVTGSGVAAAAGGDIGWRRSNGDSTAMWYGDAVWQCGAAIRYGDAVQRCVWDSATQ